MDTTRQPKIEYHDFPPGRLPEDFELNDRNAAIGGNNECVRGRLDDLIPLLIERGPAEYPQRIYHYKRGRPWFDQEWGAICVRPSEGGELVIHVVHYPDHGEPAQVEGGYVVCDDHWVNLGDPIQANREARDLNRRLLGTEEDSPDRQNLVRKWFRSFPAADRHVSTEAAPTYPLKPNPLIRARADSVSAKLGSASLLVAEIPDGLAPDESDDAVAFMRDAHTALGQFLDLIMTAEAVLPNKL